MPLLLAVVLIALLVWRTSKVAHKSLFRIGGAVVVILVVMVVPALVTGHAHLVPNGPTSGQGAPAP